MVKITSIYNPVLKVTLACSYVTEPQTQLFFTAEQLALAGEWTSQCRQPFPHLAFDTKCVSQFDSGCGGGICSHSLASSWPSVLKLAPAGPVQFSLLASQSLIEGHGNQ